VPVGRYGVVMANAPKGLDRVTKAVGVASASDLALTLPKSRRPATGAELCSRFAAEGRGAARRVQKVPIRDG
jgi:hypothetical protein